MTDAASAEPYIFISHSSHDAEYLAFVTDGLRAAGFALWVDVASIPDGSTWQREIEHGVTGCAALVVVHSANSRASEWVERELLLALELGKPVFGLRFDESPLPLALINRQVTDFRKSWKTALRRVIAVLTDALAAAPAPPTGVQAAKLAPTPNEHNIFRFIEQLPDGKAAAAVARHLHRWAQGHADNITFSGRKEPAFHAHVEIGAGGLIILSVRAYPRRPAVEVPLQYLCDFPPYTHWNERRALLADLNALMPEGEKFSDDKVNKRPNLPLVAALGDDARLNLFKAALNRVIDALKREA